MNFAANRRSRAGDAGGVGAAGRNLFTCPDLDMFKSGS
jgi:hypothetical protein